MIENRLETKWYYYVIAFFAGTFFINMLPHYIHGITGKEFPTPFADPPGVGLSSPTLNVIWALINLTLSLFLFYFGRLGKRKRSIWISIVTGAVLMSFYTAHYFGNRM